MIKKFQLVRVKCLIFVIVSLLNLSNKEVINHLKSNRVSITISTNQVYSMAGQIYFRRITKPISKPFVFILSVPHKMM